MLCKIFLEEAIKTRKIKCLGIGISRDNDKTLLYTLYLLMIVIAQDHDDQYDTKTHRSIQLM